MVLIIIITIILYAVLIAWTWNNLGGIEKTKKIATIAIGILMMYLITLVVFSISKTGVQYSQIEIEKNVRNILVAIFTGLNSLIILPFLAKQLDKIHEGEIEKEKFSKKLAILVILFTICMFVECGYMKSTQQGILKIYESNGQMGPETL